MNRISKIYTGVLLAGAMALGFQAEASQQSLGITNYIVAGANGVFTSFPTNGIGTNGICGLATGSGIDISRYNNVSFTFQGLVNNTNGTAYQLNFWLVRATTGNTPIVSTNQIDYETVPQQSMIVSVPIPASTTNVPVMWYTNFPEAQIGNGATWIGIYAISNNLANTSWVTNAAAYIGKKIIPMSIGPF